MQQVTIVFMEDPFEAQGAFLDGKLIGAWTCDDASWRSEYFNGFMEQLGIKVKNGSANDEQRKAIADFFGTYLTYDEYLEDESLNDDWGDEEYDH